MEANVLGFAGFFIIVEAALSVAASKDQRPISQVGRVIRMGIGGGLIWLN